MSETVLELLAPHAVEISESGDDDLNSLDGIVDQVQGARLQAGLTIIGVAATVPENFRMVGMSQPGLSVEVHVRGQSRSSGLSHDTSVELRTGEAAVIATQSEETWETRAKAGDQVALYTLLATSSWLERHGFGFGREYDRPLEHLSTWQRPLGVDVLNDIGAHAFGFDMSGISLLKQESLALRVMEAVLCETTGDARPPADARMVRRARAARAYLAETSISDLSLEATAQELGTSLRQLHRDFQTVFGTTPFAFVREFRLRRAAEQIRSGEMTITQAAFAAGYASASTFSRSMSRTLGLSPKQIRRK
ncbi:MAG: AraC family transcriptional regulator [Pseudomonadota bacterium]